MDKIKYLAASDGTGPAVLAHIDAPRNVGSTVISLDNTDNWSPYFILTTGTLLPSGFIDPGTQCEMFCSLDVNGNAVIEGFCPGYTDQGHTQGQVAVIKQSTSWANIVADTLAESVESFWMPEIGRTTLGQASTSVTAPTKRYMKLIVAGTLSFTPESAVSLRINNRDDGVYAWRRAINFTTVASGATTNAFELFPSGTDVAGFFYSEIDFTTAMSPAHLVAKSEVTRYSNPNTAPTSSDLVGKITYVQTEDTTFSIIGNSSTNLELIVLGHD